MTGSDPEIQLPVHLPLDSEAGPAAPVSHERALAMVDAALLEFAQLHHVNQANRPDPRLASARPRPAAARSHAWSRWAIAAGSLLALAGSAAAARFYFHFGDEPAAPAVNEPARKPVAPTSLPEAPTAGLNTETDPTTAATPDHADTATEAPKPDKAVRSAPEDLLQKANQQRALGQFRKAAQTYALVYEQYPRSLSAYVARVAGASLELEHLSNAARARKLFEQALRDQPRGALDLEARQGLGSALRELGDRAAERRALSALVGAHADSPAARRAQERLRELEGE